MTDTSNITQQIIDQMRVKAGLTGPTALKDFAEGGGSGGGAGSKREVDIKELLVECAFDPKRWCKEFIPIWDPDYWQEEAHDAFIEDRFVALSTGTGPGKTFWIAATIFFFLTTRAPEAQVLCTAPNATQLENGLWPAITRIRNSSPLLKKFFNKPTQRKVTLRGYEGQCFAVARTARIQPGKISPEGLQGVHAPHILVVVDEASGVADQAMAACDGAISNPNAYAILASNPNRRTGYFYRTITDPRLNAENGGSWRIFNINAEKAKHVDAILIRRIAENFGKDSDEYRVKVLGLPPRGDVQSLITPEQVYDAHERDVPAEGPITVSLDPARYGGDASVYYVRQGWRFLRRVICNDMDTLTLARIGWRLIDEYRADYFNIDDIGIGAGTVDAAKEILRKRIAAANKNEHKNVRILPCTFSGQANDHKKFANRRSELYWHLREKIEYISLADIDPSDLLDEELTSIQYKWTLDDAKIQIASKDQIRSEIGRSPNDADSVVINMFTELAQEVKAQASTFSIGEAVGSGSSSFDDIGGWGSSRDNDTFGQKGRSAGIITFGSGSGRTGRQRFTDVNRKSFGP